MSLEFVTIHEKGNQNEEYVELKVLDVCNLQNYLLTDTTFTDDSVISNKLRHIYWFLSKDVSKGDYVFLKTCKGKSTSHTNRAGTTTHVYFWGLDKPVWNNTGDGGVLFTLKTWIAKRA